MLWLEPATFGSQAMLAHPSTMPSLSNMVIVLNIITLFIGLTNEHDLKRLPPIAFTKAN